MDVVERAKEMLFIVEHINNEMSLLQGLSIQLEGEGMVQISGIVEGLDYQIKKLWSCLDTVINNYTPPVFMDHQNLKI